jgi:hypothetical protein
MGQAEADDDTIKPGMYALGEADPGYMAMGDDGSSTLARNRTRSYDNALNAPLDEE